MRLKVLTKQLLAVVAGLALAISTQAQDYATGDQYLDNLTPTGPYPGWTGTPNPPAAMVTVGATGVEVVNPVANGYGGEYFSANTPATVSNPNDTELQLTVTVNGNPNNYQWFSPGQLVINDSSGIYYYNMPYSGYQNPGNPANSVWTGSTEVDTIPLQALEAFGIQSGGVTVYGVNLDLDPANITTNNFDVTFNSVAFVPEPGTMSLVGMGLLGLLGVRGLRRRHSSQ